MNPTRSRPKAAPVIIPMVSIGSPISTDLYTTSSRSSARGEVLLQGLGASRHEQ